MAQPLAPASAAPQQTRGPRPLPLFLELLRAAALRDPELGKAALAGLRRYQEDRPVYAQIERPVVAGRSGATVRDCGGRGPTLVLVPSLINPPHILDLDPHCSLAEALASRHRVLLLDWGAAEHRQALDLTAHAHDLLAPLVDEVGPATLVGYCLGGTLSLMAARERRDVQAVVTLAAPWDFAAYPEEARQSLTALWAASRPVAEQLGALPMEVLQAAFWQIDPQRIVAKFARLAATPHGSAEWHRFVRLEDWANGGEPLPLPSAAEVVEQLFGAGRTPGDLPGCPALHITASGDRIVPAATAPPGEQLSCPAGHVGMIVGSNAARHLHAPLLSWLEAHVPRG